VHGGDEEGVVFEGLAGVVDDLESGEGGEAEPILNEGLHGGGGCGVGRESVVMIGYGVDEVGGGGGGGAVGDEEVEGAEAKGGGDEVRGRDAGAGGYGGVGIFGEEGEGLAASVEEGSVGWIAGVFDGEAEVDGGGGLLEFSLADGGEQFVGVAEEDGRGGGGIPEDIAEAAEEGSGGRDLVPVGGGGLGGGGSDALEALGGLGNGAGVDGGEG